YGNTDWKDQLTAYNGVGITYDGSGNPLSYRGMTMTWQKGRQLASIVKNGVTTSFTYDSKDRRIRKASGSSVNNQTVTRYYYNGDSLTGLMKGNQTVQFVYDAEGRPFLMRVYTANNGTPSDYYYLYNGQGDVTGLIDSSNSTVVHYTYDSWGKTVSITDTSNTSISTLNPFRYRGYIYDPETELYYLQSRYYDAEVCRFISPDDVVYLGAYGSILNYNLFGYCKNNPINESDSTGHLSWKAIFKAAYVVTAAALVVAAIVLSGGSAAPPLIAAASAIAGSSVSAGAIATASMGVAITGIATMGVASAAIIYEAKENNSKQSERHAGDSLYDKDGGRTDYEYNGNGSGNVHYHLPKTNEKKMIWKLQDGKVTSYKVAKTVKRIITKPYIRKNISKAINIVRSLAGLK
ncbi:MAG: RHS repeat-associated core domain-containing protein, partial [Lachnospiraceae bacterium]|nr:RHS repeat-associated core domain-containing protein [Lachnospiraceae bacterium]